MNNNKPKFNVVYEKGTSETVANESMDFLTNMLEEFDNKAPESIRSVTFSKQK